MGRVAINNTLRDPLGVVACLSPWNLPLGLLIWKSAPALVAGNAVIAKPSELAPMTAFLLAPICIEAGLLPPEVLNILHASDPSVGQALVAHPAIEAFAFTDGINTGAATRASPHHDFQWHEALGRRPRRRVRGLAVLHRGQERVHQAVA